MKKEITNTASEGLNLDLHPIVTPNSVLTDNLNGTMITYNGNEFSLQNDKGNSFKAKLSDGFVPIGIKERNGVLYIISVHQIDEDNWETEIGTYPGLDWASDPEEWTDFAEKPTYTPLKNFNDGKDFRTTKLEFTTETPLDIEIQDSYDGSVNLIISDKQHNPILINSGFSVNGNQYKINNTEVKYSDDDFTITSRLIKTTPSFMRFELDNVYRGGQLKGGNYTFYAYLGDSDGNKTDIASESGIVSIYNGDVNEPKFISGTLSDERTDKLVKFRLENIPSGYSRIYISYVREYSDTAGYLMTEAATLVEPFILKESDSLELVINGFEEEKSISIEQLNINYLPISSYKTATQQQSMLFIGNVNSNTELDYDTLTKVARSVKPKVVSKSISSMSLDYDNGDYYDPKNIYYSVGYWPGEYYRFGIVFIKSDGSFTPAFPITGGSLRYQDSYIYESNDSGVIKFPMEDKNSTIIKSNGDTVPWGLELDWSGMRDEIQNSKMSDLIKGFFVVRQKRIPEVICQGLQIHLDEKTHIPVMPMSWIKDSVDSERWCFTESFLNQEDHTLNYSPESADSAVLAASVTKQYYAYITIVYPEKGQLVSPGPGLNVMEEVGVYVLLNYDQTGELVDCSTTFHPDTDQYVVEIRDLYAGFKKSDIYQWDCISTNKSTFGKHSDYGGKEFNDTREENKNDYEKYLDPWLYQLIIGGGPKFNNDGFIKLCSNYFKKNLLADPDKESSLKSHVISSKPYNTAFGILSQEAVLDPSVRNRFDGSKFELSYRSDVIPTRIINNDPIIRRFKLSVLENTTTADEEDVNAVWVKENTRSKVINDCVFSNIIGSAENIQEFETLEKVTLDDARTTLIRGLYASYIGVTIPFKEPDNRAILRIVQLSKRLNSLDDAVTIRANDNSPFYAISNRIRLDDTNTTIVIFKGDCYVTTQTVRINRNFIDPNYPYTDHIITPDCWYKHYLHDPTEEKKFDSSTYSKSNKTAWDEINSTDVNTVSLGHWVTFKCLASSNLGLRSEDPFDSKMTADFGPRSFFPKHGSTATADKQEESTLFNAGYGISVGRKRYQVMQDIPYVNQEYSNRVMFSNIDVQSEFINGYRVFQGESYKDYDKQYGPIVKLVAWDNNIVCVFEHGIGLIGVNQQALMQTTTEQTIHIYGHGVLSDQMTIISQDYGTKYADTVVKTPIGIYGIDTDAKKIWRFSNKQGFETLSDMKIETFLNNNLASSYNINIDTVDIRTHYNSFKGDVIFTWYEPYEDNTRKICSICFNERQSLWITRYNWVPIVSENANGEFYSLQCGEDSNKQVGIYHHDPKHSRPTKWYGKQEPFEFEFVVSDPIGVNKIFENLMIVSNNVQPEELQFEFIGDSYFFNKSRIYHTVFENKFSDKRYFGNEITRNLKLYKSDPSRDKNIVVFNKPNLAWNLQAHDYKPFRNASILNDRNNVPLFGQIIETDNATEEYRLIIPQECRNIETWGRRLGNMHYKEGIWRTTIEPILYDARLNDPIITLFTTPATKWNSARIRDKWCKIRIRYSGEDLAVITAIKTIVNI